MLINCVINGEAVSIEVKASDRLLDVLRNQLGLTGTKEGCGEGECGACTIIMDGQAVHACLVLASQAHRKTILTVEGLAKDGELHPLQAAFVKAGAVQCGYCTPGMLMSAKALLDRVPHPTADDIKRSIEGNLCRCTGYTKIEEAIQDASKQLQNGGVINE